MTRHIADRKEGRSAARARRFVEVERQKGEEGSHPATKAAVARPHAARSGRRVAEFARIARGHMA
ncbi:MAG: hypothetical protein QM656_16785 [Paracoccaceae bacterium]